jgi:hypothetical protein
MAANAWPAAPFSVTVIDTIVSLVEKRLLMWRPLAADGRP